MPLLLLFECKCDEECENVLRIDHYHDLNTNRVGFMIGRTEVVLNEDQLNELKTFLEEYLNTYGN